MKPRILLLLAGLLRSQDISSVSVSPGSVVGGSNSALMGTVVLTKSNPNSGTAVTLGYSGAQLINFPNAVTVPAGATSATFSFYAGPVTQATATTVTASVST